MHKKGSAFMPSKYIKNYALSVTNTVAGLIIPIITFPYISRILGPEKIGVVNFVVSYAYYFMHIASFGIASYAVREMARVRDDKVQSERLGNEIFNLNLLFSLFSGILYLVVAFLVPRFRENYILYVFYSVTIFTNFLALDWLFQAQDDYAFTTARSVFVRLLSIVAVFIFIKKEADYYIYMIIISLSEMGSRFSGLVYARKKFVDLRISHKFLNFARHFKSLFTLFLFRIVNGIQGNLDKIMIGIFITYYEVGIYSTGVKFVFLVIPLIETVGVVIFPKITISAKDSPALYLENVNLNYKIILLLGIPMSVGMFIVSPELMILFAGGQFEASVIVSRIMSICILLVPVGDLLGSKTLLVYNKDKWLLICSAIVAVCNVVFNLVGIPLFGIIGACAATVLCYVISILVRLVFTKKILSFTLFVPQLFLYTLYTMPFVALYFVMRTYIKTSVPMLFVYMLACMVFYGCELIVFKDKTARRILSALVKKRC